mgnify:CR=1
PKAAKLWFLAGRVRRETSVPSIVKRRVWIWLTIAGPALFFALLVRHLLLWEVVIRYLF